MAMQGESQVHYSITSLATCTNASCVSVIVEICFSSLIIIWLIYEFVMQIKMHMRLHFGWQEVMLVQIFLCVSFNICFSLWSSVITWYILQSFIFEIYFTTLVYYFAMKYLEKKIKFEERKPYFVALVVVYAVFCLSQLGLFITLVNEGAHRCKQMGEIIITAIMITLGIIFFYLAYRNETDELKKFEEYKVGSLNTSPLRNIWIWVCLNIFGQIINEIENCLIYSYYGQNQCAPVESNLETDILSPIFMLLTLDISFCSTLWFYNRKRNFQQESQSVSFNQLELGAAQADLENRIEIVKYSSFNDSKSDNTIIQGLL